MNRKSILLRSTAAFSILCASVAQAAETETVNPEGEVIVVLGEKKVFSEVNTTDGMLDRVAPVSSVNAAIDDLPGVFVGEGDSYGFDDWSTSIIIRGFQNSLSQQELGMTVDGLPNGNSNYGGGAKPNRFIDTANLAGVEVSQGTADIGSLSNEALGGTLNYITQDPLDESRMRLSGSIGDHDALRGYVRYDTGRILGDTTRAWFSFSTQTASDWMEGSAENERDHVAMKVISDLSDSLVLTGYLAVDDTQEDNYQRIYSEAQYDNLPYNDGLIGYWSGFPDLDQAYRQAWSTLRANTFGYVKLDKAFGENFSVDGTIYKHTNSGRGDWVPPYLVDVVDDEGGVESELAPGTTFGGSALGQIFFVDANGVALQPDTTTLCVAGAYTPSVGAYGPVGPAADPQCYPEGAVAVQSYRHTHYAKDRYGFRGNASLDFDLGRTSNTLRGGVWIEDYLREEYRDWHKVSDTSVGPAFDEQPYWVQYSNDFPINTTKWYIENTMEVGDFAVNLGLKQFLVDLERKDNFDANNNLELADEGDSDVLLSGGLVYRTAMEGLELFAGYAENFAAFKDTILERSASEFDQLSPETAENFDIGARYAGDRLTGSVTYYDISFEDRIIFIAPGTPTGPDYLIGTNGTYFNAGGIESNGVEVAASYELTDEISVYGAYTYNNSEYVGSGDDAVDAANGVVPGNQVAGAAENMFVVSGDWNRGPWAAGLSAKYTGERFVNQSNTWQADSFTLLDFNASVGGEVLSPDFENFELSLVVNNVTDEEYLGTISSNAAWLGAPRTSVLTLTADF